MHHGKSRGEVKKSKKIESKGEFKNFAEIGGLFCHLFSVVFGSRVDRIIFRLTIVLYCIFV